MAGGNFLRLLGQVAERPHRFPDDLKAREEQQEQPRKGNRRGNPPEAVEPTEDFALRADDGHAPARRLEGRVKDIAACTVDQEPLVPGLQSQHALSQGVQLGIRGDEALREDGLVEKLVRVRMHQVGTAATDQDAVGVRVRLHG